MGILLYIKIKAAVGGRKKRSILPDILEIIQNIDTFVLHGNYPAAPLTLAMLFSREGMCIVRKKGTKGSKTNSVRKNAGKFKIAIKKFEM